MSSFNTPKWWFYLLTWGALALLLGFAYHILPLL